MRLVDDCTTPPALRCFEEAPKRLSIFTCSKKDARSIPKKRVLYLQSRSTDSSKVVSVAENPVRRRSSREAAGNVRAVYTRAHADCYSNADSIEAFSTTAFFVARPSDSRFRHNPTLIGDCLLYQGAVRHLGFQNSLRSFVVAALHVDFFDQEHVVLHHLARKAVANYRSVLLMLSMSVHFVLNYAT